MLRQKHEQLLTGLGIMMESYMEVENENMIV